MPPAPFLFATADHRLSAGRRFGIRPADLLRHVHVIGQTGAGKSVLLERLAVAAIRSGMGVGVIDPHGDLVTRLLDFIPASRTQDLVFLDATDVEQPLGWNVLDGRDGRSRGLVVSGIIAVFRKVFGEFWGPRLEHVLRNTLAALLETRDATLLHVLRMLSEESFRQRIVSQVTDPLVRFFWEHDFPMYPPALRAEMVSPVQNKIAAALTSPQIRAVLGLVRSTFSIAKVMDEQGIFLANLAKGVVGMDASALLGALLVGEFQLATYARASKPAEERQPFLLLIDEFPSFSTSAFGELLVEARKFGLGLVLAHQHLAQLEEPLLRAVVGNTGTSIVFRVGPEDAEQLGPMFGPVFKAHDFTRLGARQIVLRLAVDGATSEPFTGVTLPPHGDEEKTGRSALLRRVSRERYGTARAKVEAQVREQMR